MLATELSSELEALQYIEANEKRLLGELSQEEIKTVYSNQNTRINIMRDGKRLLRIIARFQGDKKISDIHKDMAELGLL